VIPSRSRLECDAALATITTWDNGPGVPQSELEAVFRPFYRPKGADSSARAGLGLALVRQIARRHGGEACCALQESGSRFIVTLPSR